MLEIWNQHPELRLCQLIVNAVGPDPYYITDDVFMQKLQELSSKIKKR